MKYGSHVTDLAGKGLKYGMRVSRAAMWVFGIVVLMGLLVGVFLMVAVKKAVILVAFVAILVPIFLGLVWNYAWGKRAILGYVREFPDAELRTPVDDQFVKITGVNTFLFLPFSLFFFLYMSFLIRLFVWGFSLVSCDYDRFCFVFGDVVNFRAL